jgi:hypothetical protein
MYEPYCRTAVLIWAIVSGIAGISAGNMLTDGDFESGDLSGWMVFTTANGNNGTGCPVVELTSFPMNDSNAVKFHIGSTISGQADGGGISKDVMVDTAGTYDLSAEFMFSTVGLPTGRYRPGLFELLVDEQLVASHDYGEKSGGVIYSSRKERSIYLDAGLHKVCVLITRTELTGSSAPWQFVDNVTMMPEPAMMIPLWLKVIVLSSKRKINI